MSVPRHEAENMLNHVDHMTVIAGGTAAERRAVLDDADEPLVRALSSAARVAHSTGALHPDIYEKHSRKLAIATSPRRALRTKHKLVVSQRGGGFWGHIARAALPVLGGLVGATVGPLTAAGGASIGKVVADQIPE